MGNDFITAIAEPKDGQLVVGTFNEDRALLLRRRPLAHASEVPGPAANVPTYMTMDANGEWLWVAGLMASTECAWTI